MKTRKLWSFSFHTVDSDSPTHLDSILPSSGPVGGVEEVPAFKPQVYTYVCDVGKRESVYSTAEKVRREVGEVDILINNAGVVSGHHLLECPDELIERTMVVNCHAHFWVRLFNFFFLCFVVVLY